MDADHTEPDVGVYWGNGVYKKDGSRAQMVQRVALWNSTAKQFMA